MNNKSPVSTHRQGAGSPVFAPSPQFFLPLAEPIMRTNPQKQFPRNDHTMSFVPKLLPVICFFAVPTLTSAGIDSGGSRSSGGGFYNHSSIGGPFASLPTQAGAMLNHPGLIEVVYPVTPSAITDVNANGLPDGWEVRYFGVLGVDPIADADLDGTSNLLEYIAGTDPNRASSVFRPQGTYTNGLFQMPVQTVSGRNYQIWVSRDLQNWVLQSTLSGNDATQHFKFDETTITSGPLHSSSHPSNYFFRVQIQIPAVP